MLPVLIYGHRFDIIVTVNERNSAIHPSHEEK